MYGCDTGRKPALTTASRKYCGTSDSITSFWISPAKRLRTTLTGTFPLRNPGSRACFAYCSTSAVCCLLTTSAGISTLTSRLQASSMPAGPSGGVTGSASAAAVSAGEVSRFSVVGFSASKLASFVCAAGTATRISGTVPQTLSLRDPPIKGQTVRTASSYKKLELLVTLPKRSTAIRDGRTTGRFAQEYFNFRESKDGVAGYTALVEGAFAVVPVLM